MVVMANATEIGDFERSMIEGSSVFFVASAPLDPNGHINLSPKGISDTFRILDDHHVAYLDLTGSGAETAAHLSENGRITLMWCSFGRDPNILRIHGRGRVVRPQTPDFEELIAHFPPHKGVRGVIVVEIQRLNNSCGFGVPVASELQERSDLDGWLNRKGDSKLLEYQAKHNQLSIDGLNAYPLT
ncbi:pyridoxamine 5'-phosphate oxidase [Acidithrix ferrooxidans]|uniref:Pyridoxamine 5'-phosphate oxidase n=2 Tax=Acidithrix ferrooxidans TaxID=1280514 RepID=A0A0D8HCM1_9ACTN|nr:pyridoxamine 5'-phosphate oxidase [Acidithrix ferrooxidans]